MGFCEAELCPGSVDLGAEVTGDFGGVDERIFGLERVTGASCFSVAGQFVRGTDLSGEVGETRGVNLVLVNEFSALGGHGGVGKGCIDDRLAEINELASGSDWVDCCRSHR
jgi:hypothetical protein